MTQRINSLRELLPDGPNGPEAVAKMQQYLRANIHQDNHPDEARMISQVPGDDPTQHLLYTPPNPYMKYGFAKLKRAWDTGRVPEAERTKVESALFMLAEGQAWEPAPCIAVDQAEVRYYSGNLNGDESIWDADGFNAPGPGSFNATVLHSDE